jgi:hypothetical protein
MAGRNRFGMLKLQEKPYNSRVFTAAQPDG